MPLPVTGRGRIAGPAFRRPASPPLGSRTGLHPSTRRRGAAAAARACAQGGKAPRRDDARVLGGFGVKDHAPAQLRSCSLRLSLALSARGPPPVLAASRAGQTHRIAAGHGPPSAALLTSRPTDADTRCKDRGNPRHQVEVLRSEQHAVAAGDAHELDPRGDRAGVGIQDRKDQVEGYVLRVAVLGRTVPRRLVHSDDVLAAPPDEERCPHGALAPRADPRTGSAPGKVLQWRCRRLQREDQGGHQTGVWVPHLRGTGSCSVSYIWCAYVSFPTTGATRPAAVTSQGAATAANTAATVAPSSTCPGVPHRLPPWPGFRVGPSAFRPRRESSWHHSHPLACFGSPARGRLHRRGH